MTNFSLERRAKKGTLPHHVRFPRSLLEFPVTSSSTLYIVLRTEYSYKL